MLLQYQWWLKVGLKGARAPSYLAGGVGQDLGQAVKAKIQRSQAVQAQNTILTFYTKGHSFFFCYGWVKG